MREYQNTIPRGNCNEAMADCDVVFSGMDGDSCDIVCDIVVHDIVFDGHLWQPAICLLSLLTVRCI